MTQQLTTTVEEIFRTRSIENVIIISNETEFEFLFLNFFKEKKLKVHKVNLDI
jgi:hypothetical protein